MITDALLVVALVLGVRLRRFLFLQGFFAVLLGFRLGDRIARTWQNPALALPVAAIVVVVWLFFWFCARSQKRFAKP